MAETGSRRRPTGSGSVYFSRSANRWEAKVTWVENGVKRTRKLVADSKAEAENKLRQLNAAKPKPIATTPESADVTIGAIIDLLSRAGWLDGVRKDALPAVHPSLAHLDADTMLHGLPDPAQQTTITIDEAAKVFGVSRSTAYYAARTGQIPTIKLGRKLLVPVVALRRMLIGEMRNWKRSEESDPFTIDLRASTLDAEVSSSALDPPRATRG